LMRLVDLKLDATTRDAGFGFEAIGLAVTRAEPMPARQGELNVDRHLHDDDAERCAALIDALRQRLGPQRVRCFAPVASHIPERAEVLAAVNGETASAWPEPEPEPNPRPLLLLPRAEPTEVTALVPDGPSRRFCWRGATYDITGAQGPERIAGEWWRASAPGQEKAGSPTRDYYLVEDTAGRRFWLYREGLYGRETAAARWFVQGLFA
jgi:protein ImuB